MVWMDRIDSNPNLNDSMLKQFFETWTQNFEKVYHIDFGLSVMFSDDNKALRAIK